MTHPFDPAETHAIDVPLKANEFRDLVFNAIASEPSLGDQVDITDMQNFGDGLDDPHGPRIHITLGTGERFSVTVKALAPAQTK